MDSSSSSELQVLERAVLGRPPVPGLVSLLPLLQTRHRSELRREERWTKEELVRHPEPRELIRAMRKPGNLDEHGRPVYTLDERRYVTSDIRENQLLKQAVMQTRERLSERSDEDPRTRALLALLDRAVGQAPFLKDVGEPQAKWVPPSTTLTQDPLYRAVMKIRADLSGLGTALG